MSRIEAGKTELYPGVVNPPLFLRGITDIIRIKAEEKSLLFSFDAPTNLPRAIHVDEKRLRQVLLNLLGNAVKFTDRGQVRLGVSRLSAADGEVRLRFEVQDSGIGVGVDQFESIFQPFEQVGDVHRRFGGSGLGLAGYRGPRRTVLIVDDVVGNRAMLADLLAPVGFEVQHASNGVEALQRMHEAPADLVLMDTVMAGMDGLECTRRIRRNTAWKQLPLEEGLSAPSPVGDEAPGTLVAPPAQELEILHRMAMAGNMRSIREQAQHLAALDQRYRPFAERLQELAGAYQSKAILGLVKEHLAKAGAA